MKGKLVKADVGSGAWILEGDDGKRYQLDGQVPENLVGRQVQVDGKEVEAFGFAMMGPTIEVRSIKPV